jgi:glycosyltransferase involved in cell wall biosynthesis
MIIKTTDKPIILIDSSSEFLLKLRLSLLKELKTTHKRVIAVTPNDNHNIVEKLAAFNIEHRSVSMNRTGLSIFNDMKLIFSYRKIFIDDNADALLLYTLKPVLYGLIAARLSSVKYKFAFFTGLGFTFTKDASIFNKILVIFIKKLLIFNVKSADLVFFQNPDDRDEFIQSGIINISKTKITNGSGVDVNYFLYSTPPKELSFLLIARLLYPKGIREYYKAASILKKKYPSIKFKLAGWIDSNPQTINKSELDEWIDSGVITWQGRVKDVRAEITSSSVYVLPSYREGTPRTVLEAMSIGRPIITTNAPGCKETVIQNFNGILVDVRDVPSLVKAMEMYILNIDLVILHGKNSRELAVKKYDDKKVNSFIINCIDEKKS